MFLGDFMQLPHVSSTPLYIHKILKQIHLSQTKKYVLTKVCGKNL
jgi:hypothetical protein